jgi:hypothetical protein
LKVVARLFAVTAELNTMMQMLALPWMYHVLTHALELHACMHSNSRQGYEHCTCSAAHSQQHVQHVLQPSSPVKYSHLLHCWCFARLQDDAKPLRAYNVTATSRVLVTRGAAAHSADVAHAEAAAGAEEARTAKLERLKAAADRMAERGDGRGLTDRYEFSLENQVGDGSCCLLGSRLAARHVQFR